jgi:TorA maturation chaperone TorD
MTNKREYLEAEYLATGLIGRILTAEMSEPLCNSLIEEQLFMGEPPLYGENENIVSGIALLQSWAESYSEEVYDRTYKDYMVILVGTSMPKAPPWESVYRSEEGLLFQQETADVRAWYRRFGKEIVNRGKEPDDHIGYELEFVSFLTEEMIAASDADDREKLEEFSQARAEFLEKHLLAWGLEWCKRAQAFSESDFYKGIALYLQGILEHLKSR